MLENERLRPFRWRELFLGGATRHILQHMTIPVLMAH